MGRGGIDVTPSDEREAPAPPSHLQSMVDGQGNLESLKREINSTATNDSDPKRLPRETGEDIGMGSPVPLSKEAVGIITRLRNMKVSSQHRCLFHKFRIGYDGRMKMRIGVDGETLSFALKVNSSLAKSLSSRLLHRIEGREGAEQKLSPQPRKPLYETRLLCRKLYPQDHRQTHLR